MDENYFRIDNPELWKPFKSDKRWLKKQKKLQKNPKKIVFTDTSEDSLFSTTESFESINSKGERMWIDSYEYSSSSSSSSTLKESKEKDIIMESDHPSDYDVELPTIGNLKIITKEEEEKEIKKNKKDNLNVNHITAYQKKDVVPSYNMDVTNTLEYIMETKYLKKQKLYISDTVKEWETNYQNEKKKRMRQKQKPEKEIIIEPEEVKNIIEEEEEEEPMPFYIYNNTIQFEDIDPIDRTPPLFQKKTLKFKDRNKWKKIRLDDMDDPYSNNNKNNNNGLNYKSCEHNEIHFNINLHQWFCNDCSIYIKDGYDMPEIDKDGRISYMKNLDKHQVRDEEVLAKVVVKKLTKDDIEFKEWIINNTKKGEKYTWQKLWKISKRFTNDGDQWLRIPAVLNKTPIWDDYTWAIFRKFRSFIALGEHGYKHTYKNGSTKAVNKLYGLKRVMQEQGYDTTWMPCKISGVTLKAHNEKWEWFAKKYGFNTNPLKTKSIIM